MITVDMIIEKYRELASDRQRREAGLEAAAVASLLAWRRAHGGDRADNIERFRAEVSAKDHVEQLGSYLRMFGSHERIGPLWRALADEPIDIFWPVFIYWWSMCDATWEWREIIIDTLRHRAADRPGVEFLDGDDRRFFDTLSWPLRVYRGCGRRRVRGISWTIDRERAEIFARGGRFPAPRDPVVATAEVEKTDVFFVSAQRGEDEIVIDPYRVRRLRLEPLGLLTVC